MAKGPSLSVSMDMKVSKETEFRDPAFEEFVMYQRLKELKNTTLNCSVSGSIEEHNP